VRRSEWEREREKERERERETERETHRERDRERETHRERDREREVEKERERKRERERVREREKERERDSFGRSCGNRSINWDENFRCSVLPPIRSLSSLAHPKSDWTSDPPAHQFPASVSNFIANF
jgi:hypothetical protein